MSVQDDADDEISDFDPKLMNEALDLTDPEYAAHLSKHKREEDERARRKAEERKAKGILKRVLDSLIPA